MVLTPPDTVPSPAGRRAFLKTTVATAVAALVSACGGGGGDGTGSAIPSQRQGLAQPAALASLGAGDPSLLLMLVPDGLASDDPGVMAWIDAAIEVGVRLLPVSDSQFLALGGDALQYAGLVLPDTLHSVATDDVIAAIHAYASAGGKVLLTFDFGALTLTPDGVPVYPIPKSRLSDMAGVDYILYDQLRDRTTGLGPVTAMSSMLRTMRVPPGKSMAYPGAGMAATLAADALYLPVSTADPGGVTAFDPQQYHKVTTRSATQRGRHDRLASPKVKLGKAVGGAAVSGVTAVAPQSDPTQAAGTLAATTLQAADVLEAISGYVYGFLTYPTYVTQGAFDGMVMATSPQFGLVAGLRSFGLGQVLFVNLPLTYLKGRTDAMPMHGLLGYFAYDVLRLPGLSPMPDGVPGMTINWHLDSLEAQEPTLQLEKAGIFNDGPFSVDMTAGPDVVSFGDGLGWDLDHNTVAQGILQRFDRKGHAIGSHGGWIHDYYGLNATEFNEADFEPLLVLNKNSVDRVIGHPGREYAPPEGNNPTWAMRWNESQGVVATYFGGHTGLGCTRQYRDGVLQTPNLFVCPVTPQGLYATFEEFQDFNVPKSTVRDWYHALIDFSMRYNTSRMVYMHPPGANDWRDVLKDFLSYANSKKNKLRWYTMSQLADFAAQRLGVSWTHAFDSGVHRFTATGTATAGLAGMVWRLPKAVYQKPKVFDPKMGTVADDNGAGMWLVKAAKVGSIAFTALPV